jgi:hypothetical protein
MRWLIFFLVFVISSQAEAAWHRAESPNFIVYANTNVQQLDKFIRRLELFSALMRVQTGVEFDPDLPKLKVFAVDGESGVRRAMGSGSRNVAGFYTANITGAYAFVPRGSGGSSIYDLGAETVLFHEYAHHFMLQYFPRGYPAWFVEGFAEFYSTTAFNKDGSINIGLPAMHRAYSIVLNTPLPMERMLAADPGRMSADETDRFYAWSWVLTHYLIINSERKAKFNKYLQSYAKGEDPLKAAIAAFGELDLLKKTITDYATARRITTRKIIGWKPPEPKISIDPLSAADAAAMPLLMQFVQGSDSKKEVDAFVWDARANAARYPDQPTALEMLAEGELDAENFEAATKANDLLLGKKPSDARALLRRARIAAAQMNKSGYPEGWPAVRKLIVKANRAAPNDPFPLSEYYSSFSAEGIAVPTIAVDGLQRALQLAPQVSALRMTLAEQLVKDAKRDEARIVLGPILNSPHGAELRAAARALLDAPSTPDKDAVASSEKTGVP